VNIMPSASFCWFPSDISCFPQGYLGWGIQQNMRCASGVPARLLLLVACAGLVPVGRLSAQGDATLQDRFANEAPREWEKYRVRAARFQGTYTWAVTFNSNKPGVPARRERTEKHYEFKQREGCALFLEESIEEKNEKASETWARVSNPRYGFEVRRRHAAGPWTVSHLDTDLTNGLSFPAPSTFVEMVSTYPCSFASINRRLRIVVKEPGFELKRVTHVKRDGESLAKMEFAYMPEDPFHIPLRGGWVLYDPAHYWIIREYDVQMDWPAPQGAVSQGTIASALQYQDADDGFPIIKRIAQKIRISSFVDNDNSFDFDIREGDVPESDFVLSAFGLPEPPGFEGKRPTRWYLWVGLAGIGCLVLSAVFAWRKRRAVGKT